jgi:hypothetical protein
MYTMHTFLAWCLRTAALLCTHTDTLYKHLVVLEPFTGMYTSASIAAACTGVAACTVHQCQAVSEQFALHTAHSVAHTTYGTAFKPIACVPN